MSRARRTIEQALKLKHVAVEEITYQRGFGWIVRGNYQGSSFETTGKNVAMLLHFIMKLP